MSETSPCTLTTASGQFYDLSSLASATSDYKVEYEGVTYNLNVCRGVVGEVWKVDNPENVGGFIKREGSFGDFSMGQVNTTLWTSPSADEPVMILPRGSACPLSPLFQASTAIRFTCAQNEFSAGTPKLIAALPPGDPKYYCSFFFEWPTHVACPTNPKNAIEGAHYFAFGGLFLIAFLTWLLGLTMYNRFYLHKSGSEIFPIPDFLRNLSLPKPSGKFGLGRGRENDRSGGFGWNRRNGGGGYSNVRADDHDEEEHFAGARFSLDDDEEDARDLGRGDIEGRALGEETNAWRGETSNGNSAQQASQPKLGAHQGLVDI